MPVWLLAREGRPMPKVRAPKLCPFHAVALAGAAVLCLGTFRIAAAHAFDELTLEERRPGPAPQDLICLEAEALAFTAPAWVVKKQREGFNRFTGAASGGQVLSGAAAAPGVARGRIELPEDGTYFLWVRYLDNNHEPTRQNCAFVVVLAQNGVALAEKAFDEKHIPRKHDRWIRHDYQFARLEFEAQEGALDLVLRKATAGAAASALGRHVDCLLITREAAYMPHVYDLHPVYARGRALPKQKTPVALSPAMGLGFATDPPGDGPARFAAGAASAWLYVSEHFKQGAKHYLAGIPFNPYARGNTAVHCWQIDFSTTPSEEGIFATLRHEEPGLLLPYRLDPASKHLETQVDWAAQSLAYAERYPAPRNGVRPVRFSFGGSLRLGEECSASAAILNELKAQYQLGLNTIEPPEVLHSPAGRKYGFDRHYGDAVFMWHFHHGCICSPDRDAMEKAVAAKAAWLRKNQVFDRCRAIGVMDEPGFGVSHILDCEQCLNRFRQYLQQQGLTPGELGIDNIDAATLSRNPTDGPRFYWSVRYRNHVVTEFLRTCTAVVKKHIPHAGTGVNIATELVTSANMVQFGLDWFTVFNSGALTHGETEDWSNNLPTFQISGYIMDTMRGACRRRRVPFRMLNVLGGRSSWEISTKAFSEIGRGASSIGFFRYGPTYSGASDSTSHIPHVHEAIKNVTLPTGAVEDHLLDGATARGDAAMLLSVTDDIWQILETNTYGRERMWQHLLLSHLGIRLDILGECDLQDELANHRTLFVHSPRIQRAYVAPLVAWVRDGGTLILSANALTADEYSRDLGFDKEVGLKRGAATINRKNAGDPTNVVGAVQGDGYRLTLANGLQPVASGEAFLHTTDGTTVAAAHAVGKGKVIVCGIMLGNSYIRTATHVAGSFTSHRTYPADGRRVMAMILEQAGLVPRLATDHHLVEAVLTTAPKADIITFANWSGERQTVRVTLKAPPAYRSVGGIANPVSDVQQTPTALTFAITVGAGDYVKCLK